MIIKRYTHSVNIDDNLMMLSILYTTSGYQQVRMLRYLRRILL